jgi:acyl-CoA reductase-like NAD-dependent aldehyde dehydrogenase
VTTGILPWNFPFFLIARKLAPALITGNTIVIKPSEFTPNNAIAFAEIVHEVGLPKGVFNLVLGRGETVGQELAGNPKVAMVSMTGSVAAGENYGRRGEKYHQSVPRAGRQSACHRDGRCGSGAGGESGGGLAGD